MSLKYSSKSCSSRVELIITYRSIYISMYKKITLTLWLEHTEPVRQLQYILLNIVTNYKMTQLQQSWVSVSAASCIYYWGLDILFDFMKTLCERKKTKIIILFLITEKKDLLKDTMVTYEQKHAFSAGLWEFWVNYIKSCRIGWNSGHSCWDGPELPTASLCSPPVLNSQGRIPCFYFSVTVLEHTKTVL